jgi:hypothetical protein
MRDLLRFLYRQVSTALSAIVAVCVLLLVAGSLLTFGVDRKMVVNVETASVLGPSCEGDISSPACDFAARERRLTDLVRQQFRKTPVVVGWRDQLPWGKQTRITAVIASADRAAAEASIATAFPEGHFEQRTVAIGRKVRAELSGPNVEIIKPEQTVRDVTGLQNVTFEWLVKPTRPGKTTLTLRIFNELITPDGPVELERPALVHEMVVKIGLLDWLTWQMEQTKGLIWVIGGVLTALGFAFANRTKLRRWWRRRQAADAAAQAASPPPANPPAPGP